MDAEACRDITAAYLQCRMDRELMEKADLNVLLPGGSAGGGG